MTWDEFVERVHDATRQMAMRGLLSMSGITIHLHPETFREVWRTVPVEHAAFLDGHLVFAGYPVKQDATVERGRVALRMEYVA